MVKRIISVFSFLIVFLLSFHVVCEMLEEPSGIKKFGNFYKNSKDTNYDVIFMGTSVVYNTILPQVLWQDYKITSFNFGSPNCIIPFEYYTLQHACHYTKPKVVVIDIYGILEFYVAGEGNGKYRKDFLDHYRMQLDTIPFSKFKVDMINDVFDNIDDKSDLLFNFIKYHNRWKEVSASDYNLVQQTENGSFFISQMKTSTKEEAEKTIFPISGDLFDLQVDDTTVEYVKKIVDFCEDNDIQLVFTYLEHHDNVWSRSVSDSFKELLKQYPTCKYIDLFEYDILDYKADLYTDLWHLNHIGATKVTKWLGNYLIDEFPYLVHNDQKTIKFWNDEYLKYIAYKTQRFYWTNDIIDNLLVSYGKDFRKKLYVCEEVFDDDLKALIEVMDDIDIQVIPHVASDENIEYKYKLEVRRANDDYLVYSNYYYEIE